MRKGEQTGVTKGWLTRGPSGQRGVNVRFLVSISNNGRVAFIHNECEDPLRAILLSFVTWKVNGCDVA